MNAEEVIRQGLMAELERGPIPNVPKVAEDALREACGGGPVVILDDGTLATLADHPHHDYRWHLVPVGES